jgi:predicted DNA-binding transcriptional regulator AlpA
MKGHQTDILRGRLTEFSKAEVADRLHVSTRTLELWCHDGYFPKPIYIGRRAFWRASAVDAWVEQQFLTQQGETA